MSKTLGNGVDPLDIIATHGADAMRFTLCHMTTQTQDVRMPVKKDAATGRNTSDKFDLGRNFANKLWNAARFTLGILTLPMEAPKPEVMPDALPDRWMLSRLAYAVEECNRALAEFEFSVYAHTVYNLLWNEFCDWYLEVIKPTVASDPHQRAVLHATLDTILRLLHPVMPYVTEAIYEQLRLIPTAGVKGMTLESPRKDDLLCTAGWPTLDASLRSEEDEALFARVQGLVGAIRDVRATQHVPPKRKITLHEPVGGAGHRISSGRAGLVATLTNLGKVTGDTPAGASVAFTFDGVEYRLSDLADPAAAGETGVDTGAEKARLEKLIADLDKSIGTLEGRLSNPGYAQKAPPHMVQQTKDQLDKAKTERQAAATTLAGL
jgi:valyl-tRNA synthetase